MPDIPSFSNWHHGPMHAFSEAGIYMVTAGTYGKEHFFSGSNKLDLLSDALKACASEFGWEFRAWAVFTNHYHFVAESPGNAASLTRMLNKLHMTTAKAVNLNDGCKGRKVWHQFWDVRIDFQRSYFARLNYVLNNPVKHRLVSKAADYPWCSARWFEANARPSLVRTVQMFSTEDLKIDDDF